MITRERWDVFCRVVDHYGDVGIAWRLARQLDSASRTVRLYVDDLVSFAQIERRIDPASEQQRVDGIDVRRWPDREAIEPADVVVELLGCRLPGAYLDAMMRREPTPVWIDFEHLSAEPWVDGYHGLPSPHPTLPLVKHFFYPGFGERTGGLLLEPDLDARRTAFVSDPEAVDAWHRRMGLRRRDGVQRLSLFAYDDAPVEALFASLAADRDAWSVIVPDGVLTAAIDRWSARRRSRGSPTVTTIPFVDQDDYDRLLWTSDVNVVRGEDSFVRAQAAGRPFVWHAYRQRDAAHVSKLDAFLDRIETTLPAPDRPVVRRFWHGWNGVGRDVGDAADWLAIRPALRSSADAWRRRLVSSVPLIDRLLAFVAVRRHSP